MKPDPLLVSVIVPVYNGERFLAHALRSILRQAHRPLEILVVDDGSTDNSAAIAQSFPEPVRTLHQARSGPPAARNYGLREAQGEVIAFLDADDLWPSDKLNTQLACLTLRPDIDIFLGLVRILCESASGGEYIPEAWLEPRPGPNLGCALMRRRAFDRVGAFDESLFLADDVDWFLRAKEMGLHIATHPHVTLICRRHDRNLTNQRTRDHRYLLHALHRSLIRRRLGSGSMSQQLPRWSDLESIPVPKPGEGRI